MNWTVLITDYVWPSIEPEKKILEDAGANVVISPSTDEKTLINLAKECDAILTCFADVNHNVIESAKKCVVIGRFGVGVDNIDVSTATQKGIAVTYVPDYCIDEVSDHVFALMLTWNRKIIPLNHSVKNAGWGSLELTMRIMRLRGKTLGIIGFGRIGQSVALKAKAFGLNVLVYDPNHQQNISSDFQNVSLNELLQKSDFVSLHAPSNTSTNQMISFDEFNLMKSDAFIINCARGALIDEKALYKALSQNQIAGAGIDVMFDNIPTPSNPLLKLENLIVTPHTAFFSQESTLELEERGAMEVVKVIKGEMPDNLVNPEVLIHKSPRHSIPKS